MGPYWPAEVHLPLSTRSIYWYCHLKGDDSRVRIWSLRTDGTCVQVLKCTRNGSITDLRWYIDGSGLSLIFGCSDGTVHFYYRSTERVIISIFNGLPLTILWKGTNFRPVRILEAHSRAIEALDYDPTHHWLATAAGGSIKVWGPEMEDPRTSAYFSWKVPAQ